MGIKNTSNIKLINKKGTSVSKEEKETTISTILGLNYRGGNTILDLKRDGFLPDFQYAFGIKDYKHYLQIENERKNSNLHQSDYHNVLQYIRLGQKLQGNQYPLRGSKDISEFLVNKGLLKKSKPGRYTIYEATPAGHTFYEIQTRLTGCFPIVDDSYKKDFKEYDINDYLKEKMINGYQNGVVVKLGDIDTLVITSTTNLRTNNIKTIKPVIVRFSKDIKKEIALETNRKTERKIIEDNDTRYEDSFKNPKEYLKRIYDIGTKEKMVDYIPVSNTYDGFMTTFISEYHRKPFFMDVTDTETTYLSEVYQNKNLKFRLNEKLVEDILLTEVDVGTSKNIPVFVYDDKDTLLGMYHSDRCYHDMSERPNAKQIMPFYYNQKQEIARFMVDNYL